MVICFTQSVAHVMLQGCQPDTISCSLLDSSVYHCRFLLRFPNIPVYWSECLPILHLPYCVMTQPMRIQRHLSVIFCRLIDPADNKYQR